MQFNLISGSCLHFSIVFLIQSSSDSDSSSDSPPVKKDKRGSGRMAQQEEIHRYLRVGLIPGCICDPPPPNEALVGNSEIEVLTQCDRAEHWLQNSEKNYVPIIIRS